MNYFLALFTEHHFTTVLFKTQFFYFYDFYFLGKTIFAANELKKPRVEVKSFGLYKNPFTLAVLQRQVYIFVLVTPIL